MPPPNPIVVEGQFDDHEEDPVSTQIKLVPSQLLEEKRRNEGGGNGGGKGDESTETDTDDDGDSVDDDEDDDDLIEVRSKMKALRAEGAQEMTGKSRGGGGGGGGVSDGGKNLKFLNKIFVGEYQPDSGMAAKVTNELNASHRTDKIKTKDKSHRATTEQVGFWEDHFVWD